MDAVKLCTLLRSKCQQLHVFYVLRVHLRAISVAVGFLLIVYIIFYLALLLLPSSYMNVAIFPDREVSLNTSCCLNTSSFSLNTCLLLPYLGPFSYLYKLLLRYKTKQETKQTNKNKTGNYIVHNGGFQTERPPWLYLRVAEIKTPSDKIEFGGRRSK